MNMNQIMQQAKKMQADMEKKQNEINNTEYLGKSELVEILLMGDKTIKQVTIKNKESFDAEDLEILEDMIKIAYNDAVSQIEKDTNDKMGMYAKMAGLI